MLVRSWKRDSRCWIVVVLRREGAGAGTEFRSEVPVGNDNNKKTKPETLLRRKVLLLVTRTGHVVVACLWPVRAQKKGVPECRSRCYWSEGSRGSRRRLGLVQAARPPGGPWTRVGCHHERSLVGLPPEVAAC